MDIKQLYENFLAGENQPKNWKGNNTPISLGDWRDRYWSMQKEVQEVRKDLVNGKTLDKIADRRFLERLLAENYNGIAILGNGELEEGQFDILLENQEALKAIENVVRQPTFGACEALRKCIHQASRKEPTKHNKYLVVNRTIAACSENVSGIVKREDFSVTFNLLIDEGIIADYPDKCVCLIKYEKTKNAGYPKKKFEWKDKKEMGVKEWCKENLHLIKELKEIFKEEIKTEKNPALISLFAWYIWHCKFNIKNN